MDKYSVINSLVGWFFPFGLIVLAMAQMSLDKSIYTYIHFPFNITFHAVTLFMIGIAFFYGSKFLNFLSIPMRYIASLILIVMSIHLYDIFWGLFSYYYGGGFPIIPIVSFTGITAFGLYFNSKHDFIDWRSSVGVVMFVISLLALYLLSTTGFFQAMNLYSVGKGPDPNVGNFWWVVSKSFGLMVFSYLTATGYEKREFNWVIL